MKTKTRIVALASMVVSLMVLPAIAPAGFFDDTKKPSQQAGFFDDVKRPHSRLVGFFDDVSSVPDAQAMPGPITTSMDQGNGGTPSCNWGTVNNEFVDAYGHHYFCWVRAHVWGYWPEWVYAYG